MAFSPPAAAEALPGPSPAWSDDPALTPIRLPETTTEDTCNPPPPSVPSSSGHNLPSGCLQIIMEQVAHAGRSSAPWSRSLQLCCMRSYFNVLNRNGRSASFQHPAAWHPVASPFPSSPVLSLCRRLLAVSCCSPSGGIIYPPWRVLLSCWR